MGILIVIGVIILTLAAIFGGEWPEKLWILAVALTLGIISWAVAYLVLSRFYYS